MSISQSVLLGVLQGLTEFLPVSSSGHLALMGALFSGFPDGGLPLSFEILLHLATLIAVLLFYRKTLLSLLPACLSLPKKILRGRFSFSRFTGEERTLLALFLGTLPLIAGVFLSDTVEEVCSRPSMIGGFLILNGFLLFLSSRLPEGDTALEDAMPRHALTGGLFQLLALFPGLSRSGCTMLGARLSGMKREDAVRFSFLLSVPAVIGANLTALPDLLSGEGVLASQSVPLPALLAGMAAAALTGLVSLWLLRFLTQKGGLVFFGVYCVLIGLLTLFLTR